MLVLPALLLTVAFIYWPLVYSVYLSTLDWNFVSPEREFVGLQNFLELARDEGFRQAMVNTGAYLTVLVPVVVLVPLGIALLLWPIRRSRAQGVYRAVLFSPTVISFAVAAVAWLWMFNPLGGVLNRLISAAGGEGLAWLNDPKLAFWCVIAVSAWKVLGFNLVLYIAALESVPRDYLDAAELDGGKRIHPSAWKAYYRNLFRGRRKPSVRCLYPRNFAHAGPIGAPFSSRPIWSASRTASAAFSASAVKVPSSLASSSARRCAEITARSRRFVSSAARCRSPVSTR